MAGAWSYDALGAEAPDPTSASGSKPAVAVMQFESAGATEVEASAATDRMQEELFALGKYTLVDRAQINEILQEQAFQQTGCTSTECAARVGRILGVRVLVTGKVTRLDETHWLISASMTDAETAETLRSTSIQYEGAYFDLLRDGMPILAARVAGVTPPEEPGFFGKIVDTASSGLAAIVGSDDRMSKRGFALFTGFNSLSGTLHPKSGGQLNYAGSGVRTLGLEYQWMLASPFTFSGYLEGISESNSGELSPYYDSITSTELGIELRYWMTSHAFIGGRIAGFETYFGDDRGLNKTLYLAGTAYGASAGYEWDGGWFVRAALDYAVLSSTSTVQVEAKPQSARVPIEGNGEAFALWSDIGYRWK